MNRKEILNYYPGFRHMGEITAITSQYFRNIDLSFFCHVLVYPDGKYYFLCTQHDWPVEMIENGHPPAGLTIYDQITNNVLFPTMDKGDELGWSDEIVIRAKEQFNVLNPMMITRKYADHFELFFFDFHDKHIYQKYINNFDLFENFIYYHKDVSRKLLEKTLRTPVIVDKKFLPVRKEPLITPLDEVNNVLPLHPKKYYMRHKNNESAVSAREYECLSLLAHGESVRGIADKFGVSFRTVETYLLRIKGKLNISTRDELIRFYWDNKILSQR